MISNFLSNQEISFKLTQNYLPSFSNSKDILISNENSLEYTYSRISIQKMLEDSFHQIPSLENTEEFAFENNYSLKASTVKTAADSSIKPTPRGSFRQRILEYGSKDINQSSSNIFERLPRKINSKSIFFHTQKRKPFWNVEHKQIKKSKSNNNYQLKVKYLRNSQRSYCNKKMLDATDIYAELQKSLQVTQIKIKNDESKEKKYLKCLLQNRNRHVQKKSKNLRIPFNNIRQIMDNL